MGRMTLALVCGALAVTGLAGCGNAREDAWQRYLSALEKWYPTAWGTALPEEERRESRRRLECIWARLKQPDADMACYLSKLDAMVRCANDPTVEDKAECAKPERQPCATSPEFNRAAEVCSSEAERRPRLKP